MDNPSLTTLGRHLQTLRRTRGWSLSHLAERAGIAKSNLSRLEQGDGNPTLDTLWRLAIRLEVPFGALVAPITATLGEDGVTVQLIDQGHDAPAVDAYWMRCEPHTCRRAEAHSPGTREYLSLISGALEAGPLEAMQALAVGDQYAFAADRPHAYRTGDTAATCLLTIVYGGGEHG
ncbi:XRE family transcriptional regulator [Modicisalibacter tunisiensis]|uniref:Helix-turn-helix domain-containing protein n=1 Tax=Modicisalibacter tunisiensis TaxID=390637 RepID=A0ABS7WUG8_9GAMM|nr:XRE family transcriptional regulator [Modicisalibacter tunisiensis]KXS38007.1 MAG: XRE family transcriptional regulator [Halomonadaceae bacterium T82-2]MBZ9566247.1 helix-turn-helix domain-containing protein [Modicisalibacter tunisiensis]